MSFRKAENVVKIEGILSESNLKYGSFVKNGEPVESIGGSIKVLVDQTINGEETSLEVPVHMFSSKYTKDGRINPSYESIEKVMKEFVSIAAAGGTSNADRIRINNADIRLNEFIGQNGQIVSQPRIHASFVSRAMGTFEPEASFCLEFMVSSITREVDNDGVELDPPKLKIQAIVPQYTAPNADVMNVDLVTLNAVSPGVINAIEEYWEVGGCYKASGRLNFSSKTVEVLEEVDFGEPRKTTRTISVNEFIVTGGSQAPLEGDFAFDYEDIKAGMAARKERLDTMKTTKGSAKKTPAQTTSKGKLDLGF